MLRYKHLYLVKDTKTFPLPAVASDISTNGNSGVLYMQELFVFYTLSSRVLDSMDFLESVETRSCHVGQAGLQLVL